MFRLTNPVAYNAFDQEHFDISAQEAFNELTIYCYQKNILFGILEWEGVSGGNPELYFDHEEISVLKELVRKIQFGFESLSVTSITIDDEEELNYYYSFIQPKK